MRPFADGSTVKLAEACRRFLINPGKDRDLRRWAAEGLSFLTLDGDVKEKLCEDEEAIKALIELAKQGKYDVQYALVTLLVNLTNSYEKKEIMPEMLELAKFAKHHVPQDHELDDQDFIDKRIFVSAYISIRGSRWSYWLSFCSRLWLTLGSSRLWWLSVRRTVITSRSSLPVFSMPSANTRIFEVW